MTAKREQNLLSVPKGVEVSTVGLKIKGQLSFEQWAELGKGLQAVHRSVLFWLGDWLRFGELKWGEKFSQAVEATGYAVQTLANAQWVSSRIEFSYRKENLSWTHHLHVAALDPPEQARFLKEAIDRNWGVRELREAVRRFKLLQEPERKPDYQEPADAPEVEPAAEEPEFEAMEIKPSYHYPEYPERIVAEISSEKLSTDGDLKHLIDICRALRVAVRGDLVQGIKPDQAAASRYWNALDVFLARFA